MHTANKIQKYFKEAWVFTNSECKQFPGAQEYCEVLFCTTKLKFLKCVCVSPLVGEFALIVTWCLHVGSDEKKESN